MTAPRARATGIRRPASGVAIDVRQLRRLRNEKSWSQGDLAKEAGVSISMISKIENRDRRPRAETLAAICTALGCSVSDLLPVVKERRTA